MGTSEQWLPFSAVGNLSVNCWVTGYQHITELRPTVLDQKLTENKVKTFSVESSKKKSVNRRPLVLTWSCLNGKIGLFTPDHTYQNLVVDKWNRTNSGRYR